MRAALAILALFGPLAACKREPTFDESYRQTEHNLAAKAREMDAELNRADNEQAELNAAAVDQALP